MNHIGFSVPNLRQALDRVKAGGYPIITRSEVAATQQVIDDIAPVNATTSIAFVMGPDEVKVELLENKQQTDADRVAPRPLLRSAERRDARVV